MQEKKYQNMKSDDHLNFNRPPNELFQFSCSAHHVRHLEKAKEEIFKMLSGSGKILRKPRLF